jgi:Ca2+-binding EF-hand superfamily protein
VTSFSGKDKVSRPDIPNLANRWSVFEGDMGMKPIVRYALLLSAVVIAGGGVAAAQLDRTPAPVRQYSGNGGSVSHGRSAAKFFRYDINHDGKVTRDELNRSLAQQFAQAAGSAQTIGQAQFVAFRMKDLREHVGQMFRRADWNGDGKLSQEEYMTPERVRFEYADRDGKGVIACGFRNTGFSGQRGKSRGHSGGRGRGGFCNSADLNHDGQVTHAEFDKSVEQEFAAAAKGGSLSVDAYYAIISAHVRDSGTKMFARLDKNHDGKIDRGEFTQSQMRYFVKLDRNNDGVVTRDEFYAARRTASNDRHKPGPG